MYDQFEHLVRYRETITGNLSLWKINKKSRKFNLFRRYKCCRIIWKKQFLYHNKIEWYIVYNGVVWMQAGRFKKKGNANGSR